MAAPQNFFGKMSSRGVPVVLLILQAVIFTLLCSVFILMPTVSSAYWVLTAITSQLAMLVYIALFAAAIVLRYKKASTERPYKIPMGNFGMWVVCLLGTSTCCVAIGLGFIPPETIGVGRMTVYEAILVLGIVLMSLPPVIIYWWMKK